MLQAAKAPVTPRVASPTSGEIGPLEDHIQELMMRGVATTVRLEGEGRTTAIRHLAFVLAGPIAQQRLRLNDESDLVNSGVSTVLVVTHPRHPCDLVFRLENWCRDDFIEYLLAEHSGKCAGVLDRIKASEYRFANGAPSVWRFVLDCLATDPSLSGVESIILHELHQQLANAGQYDLIGDRLLRFGTLFEFSSRSPHERLEAQLGERVCRWLSYEDIRHAVEVDRFVAILRGPFSGLCKLLRFRHSQMRLQKVAQSIRDDPSIEAMLVRAFASGTAPEAPNCASLLVRVQPKWRPRGSKLLLRGAYLQNVHWPGITLDHADLQRVSFQKAILANASLRSAKLVMTDFLGSLLINASLGVSRSEFPELGLPGDGSEESSKPTIIRRLKRAFAGRQPIRNRIRCCRFVASDLTKADLIHCDIEQCDFTEADWTDADASYSRFTDCRFDNANLQGTRFASCHFERVRFDNASMDSVDFTSASLHKISLEGFTATDLCFQDAQMAGSAFTGSNLQNCSFRAANLSMSRLALIQWEHCDFREADLRHCQFHLGSSRSGLVGSPYPSHGTRTGFYTDQFEEQYF